MTIEWEGDFTFLRSVSHPPLAHPWRGPWEAQSLIENEILGLYRLCP